MVELFDRTRIANRNPMGLGGNTKAFTCPICKGFSSQVWSFALKHDVSNEASDIPMNNVVIESRCEACSKVSIWLKNVNYYSVEEDNFELLLYPRTATFEESPNPDMPDNVKTVFNESLLVLDDSPRASAALSRLAIDMLTKELKAEGNTLNKRIGYLVSNGLPARIQKALDTVRVVGNNAVHPGEIDLSDDTEKALTLLKLINVIVNNQISEPKSIDEIFNSLPDKALKGIEERDKKN